MLVEGDFYLLSHALNQIILNAIKYTPHDSNIEVDVKKSGQFARIVVRDGGGGIPEGMEDKIFEKFFRLPGTPAGGLGLGLPIARSIVELHGGHVTAKNRENGIGAEIQISLPTRPAPVELQRAIQ